MPEQYQLSVDRFYDWAPYMSEDMQWFVKGLYVVLRDAVVSEGDSTTSIMERCGLSIVVISRAVV